jgi:hypothetical protein
MIEKSPPYPERVRTITGSFACLEQRFVCDGCWTSLRHHELLLASFLILVAARNGLSYDRFDKICTRLQGSRDADLLVRHALIKKDLSAFDGPLLQGRALPLRPVLQPATPLPRAQQMAQADPATMRHLIRNSLGADPDGPTPPR